MFVINVPPEQLDVGMIKAFKEEVHARGLGSIIFENVEEIIKGAKEGEVVKIGGFKHKKIQPKAVGAVEETGEGNVITEEKATGDVEKPIDLDNLPFRLVVEKEGMQVALELVDPAVDITRRHIDLALAHLGVGHGFVEENIRKALETWPRIFGIVVAEGTPPVDGEDAELEMVKDFKDSLAPAVTEEGFVDFKHLDLISPIEAGEVLQLRKPPTSGVPGSDVFGKVIPSTQGKDKRLQKGQNTEISEDGTKLQSTKDGFLYIDPTGKINVRPVYTVNGDVDYSTGNIEYKADILIRGDVLTGFDVKAGGDVHIYGAVEDALIEAGGTITINGGVLSSGKAVLKAGGDVSVGFVQHGTIIAGGSVHIRIEAVGSRIVAGKDVEVTKANGRIVGGELTVGGWVVAQTIGSDNAPTLNIHFEPPPINTGNPDERYENCFVSTKSLESIMIVQFGKLTMRVSHMDSPVTISIKEKQIAIDDSFVSTDELNVRRKVRKAELEKMK